MTPTSRSYKDCKGEKQNKLKTNTKVIKRGRTKYKTTISNGQIVQKGGQGSWMPPHIGGGSSGSGSGSDSGGGWSKMGEGKHVGLSVFA
jgi:hypothetical protein